MPMKKWECQCKFLLGYVDGNIVRIKRKDLYVEVEIGKVTVLCCRCGKRNTLDDEPQNTQKGGN